MPTRGVLPITMPAHQPFAAPVATLKKSQNFSGDLLMFFERKIFFLYFYREG
jgi:hypothetical protein